MSVPQYLPKNDPEILVQIKRGGTKAAPAVG